MSEHTMPVAEFHALGLIQEVNRQFLHPMGLALSVSVQMNDPNDLSQGFTVIGWGPIVDYSDSPEGMSFATEELDQVRFRENAQRVDAMIRAKVAARAEALGFFIQPLPFAASEDGLAKAEEQ